MDTCSTSSEGMTALLLLADGRFPVGGHVHSAGVEAAVADGRIRDVDSLADYVTGRLHSAALVDAALSAATVVSLERIACGEDPGGAEADARPAVADRSAAHPADAVLLRLDAEAAARIAAPPLRVASRRLGRQLLRVAGRCWPEPLIGRAVRVQPEGLHNPIALGVVGVATGLSPHAVASVSIHHNVTTPAQAAVRLLGLDPFEVAALTARVDRVAAGVAAEAVSAAHAAVDHPARLPAHASPLVEIAAIEHQTFDLRLFAT